ncbi:MAG: hypothetical protein U9N84_13915 [Actinomycetota bacterium]|nr:hypothetical protein [Actinomycetota bacterium]
MSLTPERVTATERWFVSRGVPHFIAEYNATEDVLTRALPALTLAFLISSVSAIDLDWSGWAIGFAIVGGFAALIGAWAGINSLRGRRPLALPHSVGLVEVLTFLLVPAMLPLIFGVDGSGALLTFAVQLVLLGVIYVATSYGVIAIGKWAALQAYRSVGQTVVLFAKGLPLLLLGFMFLFINAEAWQSAGRLDRPLLYATLVLFAVLAAVFVVTQIPREIGNLAYFDSWSEVVVRCARSPLAGVTAPQGDPPGPPPLSRREWGNLGLVVFVSQTFRIVMVAAMVGGFFVVFGLLVIRPETISAWTGADPHLWWRSFSWFGHAFQLTEELIQVSLFLAAFAGLYFSVYTITDTTFRTEFFEDIVEEVRESVAVRALYRTERGRDSDQHQEL